MNNELKTLNCPACFAPISGPGTCQYCGAAVVQKESKQDNPPRFPNEQSNLSHGQNTQAFQLLQTQTTLSPQEQSELIEKVGVAIAQGKKIEGIKIIREYTGLGLKESKELVDTGAFGHTGGDGQSCFPGWVTVNTPNGQIPIANLKPGNLVWAWSNQNNCFVKAPITKVVQYPKSRIWKIHVSSLKTPVFTTAHHSFLTDNGWIQANQLTSRHSLIAPGSGQYMQIQSVKPTQSAETVFNLHVNREFTFVTQGVLAHSFTNLRAIRVAWSNLQAKLTQLTSDLLKLTSENENSLGFFSGGEGQKGF